jgi:hypothetical protein
MFAFCAREILGAKENAPARPSSAAPHVNILAVMVLLSYKCFTDPTRLF